LTASLLLDRKKKTILEAIKQIFKVYQSKGHSIEHLEFNQQQNPIHTLLADNKFQVLKEEIKELGTQVNVVVKGEHLQEVERQKWMIKKKSDGCHSDLTL
jgi:hypothetical protein